MNKRGEKLIEGIFSLVIGLVLVFSIPGVKEYFDKLFNAILSGIVLGLAVGIIIFFAWLAFEHYR